MRRKGQRPRSGTARTAMVRVWLPRTQHQQAHEASHVAALQWNQLVEWLRAYWDEHESDPEFKALRAYGDGLKTAPLHSQSIQAVGQRHGPEGPCLSVTLSLGVSCAPISP